MATNTRQVLSLYKVMLRESQKFSSYNFRNYALRKIQDSFRINKEIQDPKIIAEKLKEAKHNLEIIKRQVIVGQMYATDKLVIEHTNR